MKRTATACQFTTADSWVILSPIEQSIKRKIEAIGTPLKDWDINIYRGVLTGCNEAFIISSEKRDEILADCKTDNERERTAELIRPILRGRDIKRYGYEWANLWLIATFPSRQYDIDQFPAIKKYLLSFGKERLEQTGATHIVNETAIKARKKTHNKWFETQDSISYWDDFSKPKIVWAETMRIRKGSKERFPRFSFSNGQMLTDKTCFIATGNPLALKYLLAFLNSTIGRYQLHNLVAKMDDGGWLMQKIYIERVCVPNHHEMISIIDMVEKLLSNPADENTEDLIDISFVKAVGLTSAEVQYMRECLHRPSNRY